MKSVTDHAAHPRALQSTYCDSISNWCWKKKKSDCKSKCLPYWACCYLQTGTKKESKQQEVKCEQGKGYNNNMHKLAYMQQRDIPLSDRNFKSNHCMILVLQRDLWINSNVCIIINSIIAGESLNQLLLHASFLTCQPPTDLAINLRYKCCLISGSLILKWIIIWLHQCSLLNVKWFQFVGWPLFQP